ncbi:MAG TPA: hypothetical protein VGK40_05640 [Verrucomicrobiae bacterium]
MPNSPFVSVIYRYADAMLERGRDAEGPQKTGLLLSALDRTTLGPLTNRPSAPSGVRAGNRVRSKDGALTGANPQHDENLLRLLYLLSELSSKPKYRDAADAGLKWFLQNAASPETHLFPWGEHLSWDVRKDESVVADAAPAGTHEFFRPWVLWDRCYELAPEPSRQFALGLWEHQIADHTTGAFDQQAGFSNHSARNTMDVARHAGFYLRTWAVAWAQTKDERWLHAIDVVLQRFEKKRHPQTGLIEACAGHSNAWAASTLSLAIDCDGAAHRVPEPMATRLRAFASREDEIFCALAHDLKSTGGFVTEIDKATGQSKERPTPLWSTRSGGSTTAQVGTMCVSRYENTGRVGYRGLIQAAADAYLKSMPAEDEDAWPGTFGHVISLQLAAWRSTARQVYLDRARELGNAAVEKFFNQSPLPRASLKADHYETITGADTLALALVELHLHILHITAVRCPPNTIDR